MTPGLDMKSGIVPRERGAAGAGAPPTDGAGARIVVAASRGPSMIARAGEGASGHSLSAAARGRARADVRSVQQLADEGAQVPRFEGLLEPRVRHLVEERAR